MNDDRTHSSSSPDVREQRVSNLVGDRLCIRCGYNLTGQPVLREPHYNMLIVRCPECATVASVQEYPLLGRWASRWASLLSALWFLVLIALWLGSGAAIFGFSVGTAESASQRFAGHITTQFNQLQSATTSPSPGASVNYYSMQNDFVLWWKTQDPAAVIRSMGGWRKAVDWTALFFWIPYAPITFSIGCFWSVALLGRSRGGLMLPGAMIILLACAFSTVSLVEWYSNEVRWYFGAGRREICPPVLAVSLALGAACLAAGLLAGRRVIRGLIRLLLTPRLRSPLAELWIADGLEPPQPGRHRR